MPHRAPRYRHVDLAEAADSQARPHPTLLQRGSTARWVGYPGRCVPWFQGDIGVGRESSDAGRMLRIGLIGVHGVIDHYFKMNISCPIFFRTSIHFSVSRATPSTSPMRPMIIPIFISLTHRVFLG